MPWPCPKTVLLQEVAAAVVVPLAALLLAAAATADSRTPIFAGSPGAVSKNFYHRQKQEEDIAMKPTDYELPEIVEHELEKEEYFNVADFDINEVHLEFGRAYRPTVCSSSATTGLEFYNDF